MRFFTIITRQLSRNRLYIFINVVGLSSAIAIGLLVYSFVVKEVKTDEFHRNGANIYRILVKEKSDDSYTGEHCGLLAPSVQKQISGIEDFVRIWPQSMEIKTEGMTDFNAVETCFHADSTFFSVFTFPLVHGLFSQSLPFRWAVVSERAAKKYFGDTDPVGQNIYVRSKLWFPRPISYQVVAVMRNIPAWSTLQTDIVLDYRYMEQFTDWNNNFLSLTYVQLNPKNSVQAIEEDIKKFYAVIKPETEYQFRLQSLGSVYYHGENVEYNSAYKAPQGSLFFTRLLVGITLLILFLSSCNYVMIKVVQSQHNLRMFAIQRCYGADNKSVWMHFLIETTVYFVLSGIIGICLARWLFPAFQEVITPGFHYPFPFSVASVFCFIGALCVFIVFISVSLSYYFLNRLNTGGIKESVDKKLSVFDLRRVLAFVSVAIFSLLFVTATIVNRQIGFLKNKDLGYSVDNVLNVSGSNEVVKATLSGNPDILAVASGSTSLPMEESAFLKLTCQFDNGLMPEKAEIISGDADYLSTYRIQLLEGENFDSATEPQNTGVIPLLVNQQFVRKSGLKQAVGTLFKGRTFDDEPFSDFKIIGIVKDFYSHPLYKEIDPLVISYSKGSYSHGFLNNDITTIRYMPLKKTEVLQFLHENGLSCYYVYDYARLYGKEEAFMRLINIVAVIAIFIGGLGIFAFSVFFVASRKKEVALRKINGGTEWAIQRQLNRDFVVLTLWACLFSIPLGYYLISSWLEKFAYRIELNWYFFILVALSCLAFVCLVVTWQIRKIVTINPVECLKEL